MRSATQDNLKGYRPGAPTPLELSAWRLQKRLFPKTEKGLAHQGGSLLRRFLQRLHVLSRREARTVPFVD